MIKNLIILGLLTAVLLTGFTLGSLWDAKPVLCEERGCICPENSTVTEIPCNSCSTFDPLFVSFIIDYGTRCSATEIISCEGKETQYKTDEKSCTKEYTFFSARNYLF